MFDSVIVFLMPHVSTDNGYRLAFLPGVNAEKPKKQFSRSF